MFVQQFSLLRILLVTSALAASGNLVMLAGTDLRSSGFATRRYERICLTELNNRKRLIDEHQFSLEEAKLFAVSGEVPFRFAESKLWPQVKLDVWGSQFRAVASETTGVVEIYSLGADRKSASGGNDLDDISTWNGIGPAYEMKRWKEFTLRTALYCISFSVLLSSVLALKMNKTREQSQAD